MARAIGCGFTTELLTVEKTAVLVPTPAVKKSPMVRFPARTGGRVVACESASVSPSPSPSTSAKAKKPRGLMLPRRTSPDLQEVLGVPEVSRGEALKLIWGYIKANDLQDPSNKKIVVCDEKLKKLFGKDRVGMLEISGLITPHLLKSEG